MNESNDDRTERYVEGTGMLAGQTIGPAPRIGVGTSEVRIEPGTRVGPFRIVRVLGRGGMGEVYLAEQLHPVQRMVALKLIQSQLRSPVAVAFFEVERQALATMQHPAIAQVYDAGTTADGYPYFAMEYVEGAPLTKYADAAGLHERARIALLVRACRGVQHAHQKGVIHRDLKPANVLVTAIDGVPSPKIIDFGVAIGSARGARPTDAAGERVGTLGYMSPEQAGTHDADVDIRTDVYSLGVMLCDLVPHARQSTELRAIAAKAIAPERDRRYDSAAALADDLERYLAGKPVRALPASRWYATRKLAVRHRALLTAAAAAVIAMVAGATLAVLGFVDAARARDAAEAAAARATLEAQKSERVARFLTDMLGGVDPDRARSMDRKLLHTILDDAAARATGELADAPEVLYAVADTIAGSYLALGEYESAAKHLAVARAAAAKRHGEASEPVHAVDQRIADNLGNLGKPQDGHALAERTLASRTAAFGPDDARTLSSEQQVGAFERELGRLPAAEARLAKTLARQRRVLGDAHADTLGTLHTLAMIYGETARPELAEPAYRELIARRSATLGPEHSMTLATITSLGVLYLEQQRYADAEAVIKPTLAINERVFGTEHPRTLAVVNNLAGALRKGGKLDESGPYYERGYAMSTKLFGPQHLRTAIAGSNLANFYRESGRVDESIALQKAAVEVAKRDFGPEHPNVGMFLDALGEALAAKRDYAGADAAYAEGERLLLQGFGEGSPRVADVRAHRAALAQSRAEGSNR